MLVLVESTVFYGVFFFGFGWVFILSLDRVRLMGEGSVVVKFFFFGKIRIMGNDINLKVFKELVYL